MKKTILISLAAIALLGMSGCNRYETVAGDPLEAKICKLDNGLTIYMSVNKETPRIQTYIATRVGGKNDPAETTGLAHYFEHLMFKGTQQFGTSDYEAEKPMLDAIEALFEQYRATSDEAERAAIYHQIDSISFEASKLAIPNEYDKLMAVIGANGTNAWTSQDETVYTEDIPSNQIDNWARIQADRFKNVVIRGFHTELETIYEEKNMSLTQDNRKVFEALDAALFPHHPYGKQTVLGTQEHLKNPSITNVKKYHDTYYVPNNVAICVSGDFNPDEMVATIKKYFGDWQPNPDIPTLEFEPEQPITAPIEKDVYGLESEFIYMGWPLNGARDLKGSAIAAIAGSILSNGKAGLIDLDVNQQQKTLGCGAGFSSQPDYGMFVSMGYPKEGQTLEEVRDIILEEVEKLRNGEFDESLIAATINNEKIARMRQLESNSARAQQFVNAFINGIEWKDACKEIELLSSVTKDDVVEWAKANLGVENYAIIYKRTGEDTTVQKISAPKITPIQTNRDAQSAFLSEIKATEVKPIEPVFVDFGKDMAKAQVAEGVDMLYAYNKINDIFSVDFIFNTGIEENPALNVACDYIEYLGTETMTSEELAKKMYDLASNFSVRAGSHQTTVSFSGLAENMPETIKLAEDLIFNAKADEDILANVKSDMIKSRNDSKKSQRACFNALRRYMFYGPEFIKTTTLSDSAVSALTSEELLGMIRDLFTKSHEILYYGPRTIEQAVEDIKASHKIAEGLEVLPEKFTAKQPVDQSNVVLAQYDAKQLYYCQYSNRGESFCIADQPVIDLYNEYFGGGMNTIVFQEMREARGLAYSASADLSSPSFADDSYVFGAFIATQNDKMRQAIEAFDSIINEMPESEAAFSVAKEGLMARLRTDRTNGKSILYRYLSCRRLGIEEPTDKAAFEQTPALTLADVTAAQQKWVAGRSYSYGILGDIADLDLPYLKTLGPVKIVSLEDIFGY